MDTLILVEIVVVVSTKVNIDRGSSGSGMSIGSSIAVAIVRDKKA